MADLLTAHHDAVQRLAEVPGLGVDSAQQIIAEVGATAATFPLIEASRLVDGRLPRQRGECRRELQPPLPQRQSADATHPQPSRQRRGESQGDDLCRRLPSDRPTPRTCPSDWAIAHRLCRLIWKILHEGVRYEERGPAVSVEAKKVRARKMIRELRSLGYRVEPPSSSPA